MEAQRHTIGRCHVALHGRKLGIQAAGKSSLLYDPRISRFPTFRSRFCRKFCNLYASIYGSDTSSLYKRNYLFRMNIMEEIFQIRSCIEILVNDIKIYTTDQYMLYS